VFLVKHSNHNPFPDGSIIYASARLNRGSLTAYMSVYAERWASHLAKGQETVDAYPDRIRRIRYEHLARDAEGALAGLFHFLGVDADASILAHCRKHD